MTAQVTADEDVLIPVPHIFKISDVELRLAPLPVKDVLKIVKYIKGQQDILEKFSGKDPKADLDIDKFLQDDIFKRLNGLLRLMFTEVGGRKYLTDQWCEEHLTPAHYRAFIVVFLKQNQLWEVFLAAKGMLGKNMGEALRQAGL